MKTQAKPGHPSDDVWNAPESGTVCETTSGNQPSQWPDSDDSKPKARKKTPPRKKIGTVGNHPQDRPAATGPLRG